MIRVEVVISSSYKDLKIIKLLLQTFIVLRYIGDGLVLRITFGGYFDTLCQMFEAKLLCIKFITFYCRIASIIVCSE